LNRPTKATRAGRAFLALRGEANSAGRATAEYLRLYALEGFLLRLAASPHRDRFILKGGVLLAAYDLRRPTADVDLAALATPNEVEPVHGRSCPVAEVEACPIPAPSPGQAEQARAPRRAPHGGAPKG
jgi:Nucleotidyl transferase AbiEii toxin, Type IV TA system